VLGSKRIKLNLEISKTEITPYSPWEWKHGRGTRYARFWPSEAIYFGDDELHQDGVIEGFSIHLGTIGHDDYPMTFEEQLRDPVYLNGGSVTLDFGDLPIIEMYQ